MISPAGYTLKNTDSKADPYFRVLSDESKQPSPGVYSSTLKGQEPPESSFN